MEPLSREREYKIRVIFKTKSRTIRNQGELDSELRGGKRGFGEDGVRERERDVRYAPEYKG